MLVHDETPRTAWKLAVVESLIKGGDRLVRAANIRTSMGCTNRPITKLYALRYVHKKRYLRQTKKLTKPFLLQFGIDLEEPRP